MCVPLCVLFVYLCIRLVYISARVFAIVKTHTHTHTHMQRRSRDEGNSYHCCKNCHQTVSLHCNYRRENSVHYLRTNVSCVGRQKQKGPEPTTLNYLTVTQKRASEGCWADRVNLSKCMLFTDPLNSELRLCPEGSKGKGGVRYFSS